MIRRTQLLSALASLSLSLAPYQCARTPKPEFEREETPGEALYGLSEEFRDAGEVHARERTLHFLVDRYPSSRFAKRAQTDLVDAGSP